MSELMFVVYCDVCHVDELLLEHAVSWRKKRKLHIKQLKQLMCNIYKIKKHY